MGEGEKYKSVREHGKDFKNSGTSIKATKMTKVYGQKLLWKSLSLDKKIIFYYSKNYKNKIVRVAKIVFGADVVRVA